MGKTITTKSFRVKARKGGRLQAYEAGIDGKRWEGDIAPSGPMIATLVIDEDMGTVTVLNVLDYNQYIIGQPTPEVASHFEAIGLKGLTLITDQDRVEKTEIPMPISADKAAQIEESEKAAKKALGDLVSSTKELLERAKTERKRMIHWVPVARISLKEAYRLEVISKEVTPSELIPSLDRVSVYRVSTEEKATYVVAIGYEAKKRKQKTTFKGMIKAEYTLTEWRKLHPAEKLATKSPLVEHVLFRQPGCSVALKTTESIDRNEGSVEKTLAEMFGDLTKQFNLKLPEKKVDEKSAQDVEFELHRPVSKAQVSFIKDGSRVHLSTVYDTLHGKSVEKGIKRLGTVAGLDESEMWLGFNVNHDVETNVDGLAGYINPVDFLKHVLSTCSKEIYAYYSKLHKRGKLVGRQFTGRMCYNRHLVKGNFEISRKITKGTIQLIGYSAWCPEIELASDINWLHLRVGIKSQTAAVSRSLAAFIRGVFDCMVDASQADRKHLMDHLGPEKLHHLVEYLGEAEAVVASLYQELVSKGMTTPYVRILRAVNLNRILSSVKMEVERKLEDGKFSIEGSVAGAITVMTEYTDLGQLNESWVRTQLEETSDGEYGKIFSSVCLNGTFLFSREAIGFMHVSLGTCDFDDWFGFIPSNLEVSGTLSKEEEMLNEIFGSKGLRTAQYLGVFFRWPQGFREARQVRVWITGETKERKLYPNVAPWVHPWEPGMKGVKGEIQDCTEKLFPKADKVGHKAHIAKEDLTWEQVAAHTPISLIGRFYNGLVSVLGHLVVKHKDPEAIAKAMENCKEALLLYSTSDIVDLEKMGEGAEYEKVNVLLRDLQSTALEVPEFFARHAGRHKLFQDDAWSKGWEAETEAWGNVQEEIQKEIHSLAATVRTELGLPKPLNINLAPKVIGNLHSDSGHHYSRFLLQKWSRLWIQMMEEEKALRANTVDDIFGENEELHNLAANMRRVVFTEMEKSVSQVLAAGEQTRQAVGMGLLMEFISRAGVEGRTSDGESYVAKGGQGFLSSPAGFSLIADGIKPVIESIKSGNAEPVLQTAKGLITFSASTMKMEMVGELVNLCARMYARKAKFIFDAYVSDNKQGDEVTRYIVVAGVAE